MQRREAALRERRVDPSEPALAKALARLEENTRPAAISKNPFSALLNKERERDDGVELATLTPFERMAHCQRCLAHLDTVGWSRSYHQVLVLLCLRHSHDILTSGWFDVNTETVS